MSPHSGGNEERRMTVEIGEVELWHHDGSMASVPAFLVGALAVHRASQRSYFEVAMRRAGLTFGVEVADVFAALALARLLDAAADWNAVTRGAAIGTFRGVTDAMVTAAQGVVAALIEERPDVYKRIVLPKNVATATREESP